MEKILKLFTYVDGRNDTPFPNEQEQVVVSEFRGDYKRMGATPTISCTVMHHKCLDKLWTDNVYATFNGERFFIKQTASSSYDNTDSRYKHEVELVSERIILDNVYFYDVVQSDVTNDKPVSNSSNVVFFGDIHEFANRLNYSLQYSKVGYSVVVDDGISSEGKMMSFQNQFFSNVLQEIYNTYEIPYYFVGKVIHIGYTNNAITHTFKYGIDESLLSIQKQNANYKLVNRVTGVGSADNIPYYYPNDYESKEEVEANGGKWINPQPNLMPSIYRETLGEERFYKALNDTYVSPQTGEYYSFENPFIEGKPKEHIVNFDEIKPSIKGMLNASNQRIDMFVDFAYDADDNDETDDEGNYLHPYFFAKLRKFDGDYGFNLFDHAIDEQEMVISMTSGSCGACEWIIGVDETSQKNTVQVNSSGNLVRDDKGNIKFGTPQDRQNDTRNYEVWVALKKDINTFGVIMPNASSNYKPSVNDTFVILHIDLPKAYILAAENNLKEQLIKYMAMNNSEKFTFSISFSRIFFAENPQILAQLNENARIQIEYDNTYYELYVSSYSYNMSNGSPLPEIKVELSDTLSVQQNALQNAISEVKQDIMSSVGSGDFLKQGLAYFLRKDTSDRTRGKLSSDVGFEVGKYVSGASGAIIYKDSSTGQTIGELDKLYVRMKAYFETLVISEVNTISGKQMISPAGSIKCVGVDELENAYRCYFLGEQDGSETSNLFHVNDQAYSQTFNAKEGVNNKLSNTYYWRLITNVSSDLVVYKNQKCHYIDLSKTDCDQGSDIPKDGDIINHRGSRTDIDRMNFIESSSVDAFSPNITLFHGVNSYSLDGKDYVSYGVDKTTNKAYMNVYGDMFVGDRNGSTYMRYTPEEGLVIKGKLDIETKLGDSTLKDLISASSPEGYQEFVEKVTQDIEGLQQQIDGAIESYFYQYEPTLSNYPASSWNTKELKDAHLNDTFTNLVDGRSWRWTIENGNYKWTEITDTATTQALALAGQAQDTADGKRRVFVAQPKPPYDKGDLWSRGKDYPLLVCVTAKGASGSYDESDWDYADNTEKIQKELEDLVSDTKDELNNAIGQATEAANKYTDNAKSALQTSINELNNAKANVNDVYTKAQADGLISKAEEDAINAAKKQADAAIALSETIVKAYADGVVDAEEAARIKQAQENLETAKKYAEEMAEVALNDALSSLATFNYLKAALKEDTSIEGGLIQSSLIKLGYTSSNTFKVMSGSNGIYNSSLNGGGIASWWGGDTYDLLDYYNWDGTQWVKKSGVTVPSNIPSGLIRFDGTGYFAKGKFWWDNNGEIHADPTALLLSFDVATGDETLASTIINIRKDLASFMDMWEVKKLSDGTEYLYSKRHLATNGGVTMYANENDLDIPTIYDGLPIDGTTIYWSNGVLKASSSGSTTKYPLSWSGFNQGSYDGSVAQSFYIPTKLSEFVNDKSFATTSDLSGYLPKSGGTINGSLVISNASWGAQLTINRSNGFGNSVIQYTNNVNGLLGSIGVAGEGSQSNDFHPVFNDKDGKEYRIYHSGNLTKLSQLTDDVVAGNYLPISTYTASNILSKLLTVDGEGSGLDADTLDGYNSSKFIRCFTKSIDIDTPINDNNAPFILRMGNAAQNPNTPYSYANLLHVSNTSSDTAFELLGAYSVDKLLFRRGTWYADGSGTIFTNPWKEIAFTDSNVASATKLQTARTIWGQSFDGTSDVSGHIKLNNDTKIYAKDSNGSDISIMYLSPSNNLAIGIGMPNVGRTLIRGKEIYIQRTDGYNDLIVNYLGNVLIGTTTDSGYKLDVQGPTRGVGDILSYSSTNTQRQFKAINTTGELWCGINTTGEGFLWLTQANTLVLGTNSKHQVDIHSTGNVSIGTSGSTNTDRGYRLDVLGNMRVGGDVTFDTKLTLNGIPIYKSQDDVLYIDGNLVVRGGITMYAENEVDIPTLMDSIAVDSSMYNSGGVIGVNRATTSSVGVASFNPSNFTVDANGMVTLTSAPSSGASSLGKLDNVDDSIDATASVDRVLYQPAGSAMWVSKPLSEIGGGSSGSGGSVSGDYLPLSGGTLTGTVTFQTNGNNAFYINEIGEGNAGFSFQKNGSTLGAIRLDENREPSWMYSKTWTWETMLHAGNYSSYALPLSGGTLIGGVVIAPSASYTTAITDNCTVLKLGSDTSGMNGYNSGLGFNALQRYSSNYLQHLHAWIGLSPCINSAGSELYDLVFATNGSTTANTSPIERMRITHDGSVKIQKLFFGNTNEINSTDGSTLCLNYEGTGNILMSNNGQGVVVAAGWNGLSSTTQQRLRQCMFSVRGGIFSYMEDAIPNSAAYVFDKPGMYFTGIGSNGEANTIYFGAVDTSNCYSWVSYSQIWKFGGSIITTGGITMYSDQRKKTILNHVELSLKQIADAPLIEHYYNSDQDKITHVGSIAQYWAGLNDWFCKLDAEGFYTMEIQNCALASAISIARHLEKYESKTDKKIRMLKKRITELEDKLEKLEGGNYGC